MTKREFFVKAAAGEMNEEMAAFAAEQLVKMDETLAKRKGKVSEREQAKRDANEALARRVVAEILGAEAKTATDIAAEMNALMPEVLEKPANAQKASAVMKKAMELDLVVQSEVKIPKKGTQKAYTVKVAEAE
jgi:hypothetical protein